MNKAEAQKRILKLRQEIDFYREQYHVYDREDISPAALDSLKHELYTLEQQYPELITPDSPTQRVAGRALEKFPKVEHQSRMLSLEDVFSWEEIEDWEGRMKRILPTRKFDFYCELKMDGLAISLIYEYGVLKQAATRGDGFIGEDVTQNIKTIEAIPLSIPDKSPRVEVRGEAYIDKKTFNAINKRRVAEGLETFANPRNLAAGSIRQLDANLVAERHLSFLAYGLFTDLGQKTHQEEHQLMQKMGFRIGKHDEYCKNIEEVWAFCEKWKGAKRDNLPYEIDGVVIMSNDLSLYEKLGVVGKTPRYAVAYKFPAVEKTTVVKEIVLQLGRTGALTPVAILEPVEVAGSTISRATLHNFEEIKRLDLRIGDTVIIQKAGDVIPKIVQVLPNLRQGTEKVFKMPKVCPNCHQDLERKEGETLVYCTNKKCFSKQRRALLHFIKTVEIDGIGEKNLDVFVENNLLDSIDDLYQLAVGDLLTLPGFAAKKAQNIIDNLNAKKNLNAVKFLAGLNIRHVGVETSRDLLGAWRDKLSWPLNPGDFWDFLSDLSAEALLEIPGIGENTVASFVEYFADKNNQVLWKKLGDLGIRLIMDKLKINSKISGKTFVVTGTLEKWQREEVKDLIVSLGGKVSSSVSKNVDYVLAGEEAGQKRLQAEKLGVKILTEEEFLQMIK
ncbi:MAG TPA: NAD-dependent DNA ligase LigA [bacterium]|nr:NAD-dependent DNA ligase LigA [bacterium]